MSEPGSGCDMHELAVWARVLPLCVSLQAVLTTSVSQTQTALSEKKWAERFQQDPSADCDRRSARQQLVCAMPSSLHFANRSLL